MAEIKITTNIIRYYFPFPKKWHRSTATNGKTFGKFLLVCFEEMKKFREFYICSTQLKISYYWQQLYPSENSCMKISFIYETQCSEKSFWIQIHSTNHKTRNISIDVDICSSRFWTDFSWLNLKIIFYYVDAVWTILFMQLSINADAESSITCVLASLLYTRKWRVTEIVQLHIQINTNILTLVSIITQKSYFRTARWFLWIIQSQYIKCVWIFPILMSLASHKSDLPITLINYWIESVSKVIFGKKIHMFLMQVKHVPLCSWCCLSENIAFIAKKI